MAIPCLADTDSIALSQDAGTGELNADVVVDPDPNNGLTVSSSGVMVRGGAGALLTALPSTPYDGQVISYDPGGGNGEVWTLRYNAASASAYKWEWVGGTELLTTVVTFQTTNSAAYVELATPCRVILPSLDGDYLIDHGSNLKNSDSLQVFQSVKLGGAAATDSEGIRVSGTAESTGMRRVRANGLTAGVTLALVHKGNGGSTISSTYRWLSARPVRVR